MPAESQKEVIERIRDAYARADNVLNDGTVVPTPPPRDYKGPYSGPAVPENAEGPVSDTYTTGHIRHHTGGPIISRR